MTMHMPTREIAAYYPSAICAPVPLTRSRAGLAPCIALVGCDGSGKSTLARDLAALLDRQSPTRTVYLGLGTGDLGRRIGQWPVVGAFVERYLTGKASKAHSGRAGKSHEGREKRLPGLVTALAMYGLSLARRRRFRQVLGYRGTGVQVIADRYPQAEVSGSFDGPGLSWSRHGSAVVEWLAARERVLYAQMAACRPTVVIRLNVDADTAIARKSDHRRDLLDQKLAVVPALRFGGAQIVDIDATRPYHEVLQTVLAVLRRHGVNA